MIDPLIVISPIWSYSSAEQILHGIQGAPLRLEKLSNLKTLLGLMIYQQNFLNMFYFLIIIVKYSV